MCIICEENYDINMTDLDCNDCDIITEIPYLPNLESLWSEFGLYVNKKDVEKYYKIQTLKRKLLNLHRLNKKWKVLWKIAEYYTKKEI